MSETETTAAAIAEGSDPAAIDRPEMVLVAREWAAERARKFRDERNNSIEAWAWRTYADLCEIAEFDTVPPDRCSAGTNAPSDTGD